MVASSSRRWAVAALVAVLTLLTLPAGRFDAPIEATASAAVAHLPDGFRDELLFGGLSNPTAVAFAADGRVFVAEKRGRVLVFDGPGDQTATVFANLETNVHNYWDRGLLGLTLAPNFPSDPSVYVLYTYNKDPNNATVPRWTGASVANDPCPNPPGGTADGCPVLGRLSKLTASGNVAVGGETVLVQDWCDQFPSHTIGHLAFGADGALYASGGDGASFSQADYGQLGGTKPDPTNPVVPANPCGDPPGGVGTALTAPSAEGGALRSQDLRTSGDPVSLDGTIIRINAATGAHWPGNANAGHADPNGKRIIAYGLRNPFRFAIHPTTGAVWVGDVGNATWEEINEIPNPNLAPRNFGWPCREGTAKHAPFDALGLSLCTSLDPAAAADPFFAFRHGVDVVAGDGCVSGGSSISGLAFAPTAAGGFPSAYDGGLFFTDYSRGCIWWMPAGAGGRPNAAAIARFADLRPNTGETGGAVFLTFAPEGDLVYADFDRGEVRRIRYYGPNVPPTASFTATPSSGPAPLTVSFNASGSSDPNNETLSYAWDLDGDGAFDDATGVTASRTYGTGDVTVGLRVTDGLGLTDTATRVVSAGNTPPSVSWTAPSASLKWSVGQVVSFSATATDAQDGTVPASGFEWSLSLEHCPSGCHSHVITSWSGVRSGSFEAPDHEVPSHLRLTLRVVDSKGLATTLSRDLHPTTVTTSAVSSPAGIPLTVGNAVNQLNPSMTSIAGADVSVSAPDVATVGESTYRWSSWSDGGARVHDAVAGGTLTARYVLQSTTDAANTCSAAAKVAIGSTWRSGRLGSSGDVDWYRFTLGATTRIQVVLGDVGVPSRLELYRGCSTRVAVADRSGIGSEEIVATLPAGTHAIRISGSGSSSAPGHVFRIRSLATGVLILSTRTIDDGSSLRLVGELYNTRSDWRGPVKVTASLWDAGGRLLATRTATADHPWLSPGGRSPFRIVGSRPAGFAKVTYKVTSFPPTSVRTYYPTVTSWSGGVDGLGRYVVSGTIRNGSRAGTDMRLAVTLHGRRREILDGGLAKLGTAKLAANQSTSFTLTFTTPGLAPDLVAIRGRGR